MKDRKGVREITPEEFERLYGGAGVSGSGYESEPSVAQETLQAVGDIAKSGVQSATFETLDDIIGIVSPKAREAWRENVSEARERNPVATTIGDILSPNPAGKLNLLGKGVKGLKGLAQRTVPELATSVAYQIGTEGEVGAGRTALDVGIGKTLGKVTDKLLVGDRAKRRASTLGLRTKKNIDALEQRAKGQFVDEFINKEVKDLENMKLFDAGSMDFDMNTLSFKPVSKVSTSTKIKGAVIPPSDKEILKRTKVATNKINDELEKIVAKEEFSTMMPLASLDESGMLQELEDIGYSDMNMGKKVYDDIISRLEDATPYKASGNADAMITPDTLLKVKRDIYQIINKSGGFDKSNLDTADKIRAYQVAANKIKNLLDESIPDPRFRQLNETYGKLSNLRLPLKDKFKKDYVTDANYGSAAYGSPMYKLTTALSSAKDVLIDRPSSQASMTLERNPQIQQYLRGMESKVIPELSKERNPNMQNRSPDSIAMALTDMRIPRSSQGILENKQMMLAKVAQSKPEAYPMVKSMLDSRPQDLGKSLPMLIGIAPELFETDEYDRIDGKILNPMMADKARSDIMNDLNLSNTEKIEKIDKLNRTLILEDYK